MAKKDTNQHLAILQDIRNKVFKPVYLLMGEFSIKYVENDCYLGRNRNSSDKKIRRTAGMPCSGEKWIAYR